MSVIDELFATAEKLDVYASQLADKDFNEPLDKLERAANRIGKAWSQSWFGYHSRVYYEDFSAPPAGARFSQEWGLMDTFAIRETRGNWTEYTFEDVVNVINQMAGNPDITLQERKAAEAQVSFEEAKYAILSCFSRVIESKPGDKFIEDLRKEAEKQATLDAKDFIAHWRPSGQTMSRDSTAILQGMQAPPHLSILAKVHALRQSFAACGQLGKIARRLASHLTNQERISRRDQKTRDSHLLTFAKIGDCPY